MALQFLTYLSKFHSNDVNVFDIVVNMPCALFSLFVAICSQFINLDSKIYDRTLACVNDILISSLLKFDNFFIPIICTFYCFSCSV